MDILEGFVDFVLGTVSGHTSVGRKFGEIVVVEQIELGRSSPHLSPKCDRFLLILLTLLAGLSPTPGP